MLVNMPIEVAGEFCVKCPKLDVDVVTNENIALVKVTDGVTKPDKIEYTNHIKCKYFDECKSLFDLKQNFEEAQKSKTTKQKTVAKKTTKKTK